MELESKIAELVQRFADAPTRFFAEPDLLAVLHALCLQDKIDPSNGNNWRATEFTSDGHETPVIRFEYDTVWRYPRGDKKMPARLVEKGTTKKFDLAVLHRSFITGNEVLSVINKHESAREANRRIPWENGGSSGVVAQAVEIKMSHRRSSLDILKPQIKNLEREMKADARKLAAERIGEGYVIGFSHGPLPDAASARKIVAAVVRAHEKRCGDEENLPPLAIRVLLATPARTYLSMGWKHPDEFPAPEVTA